MNTRVFLSLVIIYLFIGLEAQHSNLNFFSINQKHGLSNNSVTSIAKDSNGYFWFGTENGLNLFDGYSFTRFFKAEDSTSLPDNKIHSLYISSTGVLWIGCETEGLCKFIPESESFKRYNFSTEEASDASKIIKGFAEDKDSVLYVATSKGVFYKSPDSKRFNSLSLQDILQKNVQPSENSLVSPRISAITTDEDYGVWIAYEDWWISYYDPVNQKFKHYNLNNQTGTSGQKLITSLVSYNEKLWIGTIGAGLIKYNPSTGSSEKFLENDILSPIQHLLLSEDSILWISGSNGLINFNPETNKYNRFTNIVEDDRSLSTTAVQYLYEDNNGILWVGTTNAGINYAFPNKQFKHMLVGLSDYHTLGHRDVTTLLHDKSGNLWLGYRGGFIELHNHTEEKRYNIEISSIFNPYGPGTIFDIKEDVNGEIYCGSWQGGLQKFNRTKNRFEPLTGNTEKYLEKFEGADIRDIEVDKNGDLWIAVHGKGVYRYNIKTEEIINFKEKNGGENNTGISNNWVFDICLDGDEYIWVTTAHGLSRISTDDYEIKNYYKTEKTTSLPHNTTTFAYCDQLGNIWIGTPNHLNLYVRGSDRFQRFDPGLSSKPVQIKSLVQDSTEIYWAGTSGGIIKFKLNHNPYGTPDLTTMGHFDNDDGLQSESFNMGSTSFNSDGVVFFGGDKGVDYFNPQDIQTNEPEPLLRVKSIKIHGERIFPGTVGGPALLEDSTIKLRHTQNLLGIEYVALNYFNTSNNLYSYMLEPLNSDWVDAGTNRELLFSNLEPGHYSLSLRVLTEQEKLNVSNDILKFYISPPFWKTLWFKILVIIFILLLITLSVLLYTRNLRRKKLLLESQVEQRTNELSQKNRELKNYSEELIMANTLLKERQEQIQDQSEELIVQSKELSKANEELNSLNSMKDKLFSIIAHDLRNPFNTLMGFSEMLKEDYDSFNDSKRKELTSYIYESATGSRDLLDNLLNWSRSQTKRIEAYPEKIEVSSIVEDLFFLYKSMLEKKKISFETEIEGNITLFADKELLHTVLRNTLSNAIKFTPSEGRIVFRAYSYNRNKAVCEVQDTGTGMAESEIKNIFRLDSRSNSRGTAGEKGTGLGMILCKEFTELMNGKIEIKSEKDRGTTVLIYLPAQLSS